MVRVSTSASRNIIELRRVLVEKFPGVRMDGEPRPRLGKCWETGVAAVDAALEGGLAKSAITELVTVGIGSGSSLLIANIVRQAVERGEWLALIDAADSFDAAALEDPVLQRFLWARCKSARDAIAATDMVLYEGTASVAILDFAFTPLKELRRVPSTAWFRLERMINDAATALLVITPEPVITSAQSRLRLEKKFTFASLKQREELLLTQIVPDSPPATFGIAKIA